MIRPIDMDVANIMCRNCTGPTNTNHKCTQESCLEIVEMTRFINLERLKFFLGGIVIGITIAAVAGFVILIQVFGRW